MSISRVTPRGFRSHFAGIVSVLALTAITAQTSFALNPGIPSTIKKVYVISQTHVDIGFDYPPEPMANMCKQWIDTQIAYARTHPGFRYTIEHTWMLQSWRDRSTTAQANELADLLRSGQFALGAANSTLHSAKAGVEQMNRLLWRAERARQEYGIPVDTMLFNDVPGVAWSYPQVLAKSGIKYLVCGENTFIGGGFTQPYASYLFYWKGPDGSRVLTWSTKNAYIEGWHEYGIPFGPSGSVNKGMLGTALTSLTLAGYPYDAILVEHSADAQISQAEYSAATQWNAANENPQIIPATAHDFFTYMEGKYAGQIPEHSGNWITSWDTSGMTEPRGEKIAKSSQDQIPANEKAWAIASALGKTGYPTADFDNSWYMQLLENDHAGAGGCWDYYWTQAQVDEANQEYWNYARSGLQSTTVTQASASEALLPAMQQGDRDTIAVFNPLSWQRNDVVRVNVSATLFGENFTLTDPATNKNVPYQKDSATSQVIFIAPNVASLGLKSFNITHSPAPTPATSLVAGTDYVENSFYRVKFSLGNGSIISITDKRSSRELVKAGTFAFNGAVTASNSQYFWGTTNATAPSSATLTREIQGPVAMSIRASRIGQPVAKSEIILYNTLDRIDIVNTPDRRNMTYAPYDANSVYYGFAFPLDLAADFSTRVETAAGWLDPKADTLPGSYTGQYVIQHGLDLSEANYGVTFSTPDVFVHGVGGFANSTAPTIVSTFIRYGDETKLKGGSIGYVIVEPGADPQWDLRYSLRPHNRAFDKVADARFGWEACTPMMGRQLTKGTGGTFTSQSLSFFSVDAPNVIITSIKKADFGSGLIVKLQEIGRTSAKVTLKSPILPLASAWYTTPLEETLTAAPLVNKQDITFNMGPSEIRTLRLLLPGQPRPASASNWDLFR